jgi:hypothetical protein
MIKMMTTKTVMTVPMRPRFTIARPICLAGTRVAPRLHK